MLRCQRLSAAGLRCGDKALAAAAVTPARPQLAPGAAALAACAAYGRWVVRSVQGGQLLTAGLATACAALLAVGVRKALPMALLVRRMLVNSNYPERRGRVRARAIEHALHATPPSAALQYFVDATSGAVVGTAEAAIGLGGLAMRLTKRRRHRFVPVCDDVPFRELNMQLVGSGGASGLLRMQRLPASGGGAEDAVAVHVCDAADTTAYVRYPGGAVLAHDPRADLDGFVASPRTGELEAALEPVAVGALAHVPPGVR